MISDDKIIGVFCKMDDFMKKYKIINKYALEESKSKIINGKRKSKMSDSYLNSLLPKKPNKILINSYLTKQLFKSNLR